ncbi:MAG: hypothetical protein D6690_17105 [Nitrospirae bacterium]|nr:MAG: hypothetical protein D6690_17105 [Nitrospirota bacterium]
MKPANESVRHGIETPRDQDSVNRQMDLAIERICAKTQSRHGGADICTQSGEGMISKDGDGVCVFA